MAISMNEILDVEVNVGSLATTNQSYDMGLIVVPKATFPSSVTTRTAVYSSVDEIRTAGFTNQALECAQVYFAQSPTPNKLCIGYQDTSETPQAAVVACRTSNSDWYACAVHPATALTDVQNVAIANAVQSLNNAMFVFITNDENCLVPDGSSVSNIFKTLGAATSTRSIGFYVDSTQGDAANTDVAVLGLISGLNSTTANSAYTLAFKSLVNVPTSVIDTNQYTNLISYNGNAYVNIQNKFNFIMQGKTPSGRYYDEVFAIDVLTDLINTNVMNLLSSSRMVPQTNNGVAMIVAQVEQACDELVVMGYCSPGIWRGPNVLDLSTGDAVPNGYVVMAQSVEGQSDADRENRIAPTIYACVKLSGAVQYAKITVYVNR